MACWICNNPGSGDPDVGIAEDTGICPHCERTGYEENCPRGCYTDPQGDFHECSAHEGTAAERHAERRYEAFHGGSQPQTMHEQYQAAVEQKRKLG